MASISFELSSVKSLKKSLTEYFPDTKSSHLSEAIASALGFRTHASLLAKLQVSENDPPIMLLDDHAFNIKLTEFGYLSFEDTDDPFSFEELQRTGTVISTVPPSADDIEYKSIRNKAWRNLMVCAVNEGLKRKLFSLRENDDRWPGSEFDTPDKGGKGYVFDFSLPDGKSAKGYVAKAGFGELLIHAAANPKNDDMISVGNAGFRAGDAFACGWLERRNGAWLQSATDLFTCRKNLLESLASIAVKPFGYGEKGRVII